MALSAPPKSGWTARRFRPSPARLPPWACCRSARCSWGARAACRSTTWPLMMLRFPPVASVSKAQLHLLRPSPLEGEGRGRGLLEAAIHAMDRRGVRYGLRKGSELVGPYQPGAEVDIMINPNDTRLAEHALTSVGFRRLRAP